MSDDYEDNEALQQLMVAVVKALPELQEAQSASIKAFYSAVEPEHIGGKCRKLDGAVKFQTGNDFFILIHKAPFVASDALDKVRLICHELHHIALRKETFYVRHHEGDFCEIPEHDRFSYRLAVKAMSALSIKYDDAERARRLTGE